MKTQPHPSDLKELLEELRLLAVLVSREPGLRVVEGAPGSGWSINRQSKIISMDGSRLRRESATFNRGLLLHEAGHAAITRLGAFLQDPFFRHPLVYGVLNAIEDTRLETWLGECLPGCRPWIREYNDALIWSHFPNRQGLPWGDLPPLAAFALAIVGRWWHGVDGMKLPPAVEAAWEEAQPFLQKICRAIPLGQKRPENVEREYRGQAIACRLAAADLLAPPDTFEMEVRVCQADMWQAVQEGIVPILRRIAPDLPPAPKLPPALQAWLEARHLHDLPPVSLSQLGLQPNGCRRQAGRGGGIVEFPRDPDQYEQMVAGQHPAIERLGEEVIRLLQPETRRRWQGPFPGGSRLCLRSVFRAEGDSRRSAEVWQRPGDFLQPAPHFCLLVDVSGSMDGDPIRKTAEATVLLAEVCRRGGIALSVHAFSGECRSIVEWEDGLTGDARAMLGGLPQAAAGGTCLAPALRQVRSHLEQSGFQDRFLVVLSDGHPDNPPEVRKELAQLRAEGIRVIGLGLGPETRGLARFIPNSLTELQPEAVPTVFSRLLLASLQGA